GLRWNDFDPTKGTLSVNRGLVAIGYDVHETRGKTRNARRRIDLDSTTVAVLTAWQHWQLSEQEAAASNRPIGCSPTATAPPFTPTPSHRPSSGSPAGPGSGSS